MKRGEKDGRYPSVALESFLRSIPKPYRDYYKVDEKDLVPSYDNTYDETEPVYRKIQDTDVTVDPLDLFYARVN